MLPVDRSSLPQDVRFVELNGGKVHVERTPRAPEPEGTVPAVPRLPNRQEVVDWLLGMYYTRCGLEFPGRMMGARRERAWVTEEFADENLCQRCVQTVPEAERARLFEHKWLCPHCGDYYGNRDEDRPPVCDMCKKAGRK